MDPALRAAIKERVELGHTDEQIHAELREAGYDDATIERVVREVRQEHSAAQFATGTNVATQQTLVGSSALLRGGWQLFTEEWRTILTAAAINIGLFLLFLLSGLVLFLPMVTTLAGGADPMSIVNSVSSATMVGVLVWFVVGLITYSIVSRLVMFAVLRKLVQKTRQLESFKDSLSWSFRHVIGIFVIIILIGLVTNFGYTLLFFPGLALAIYLFTTTYLFAAETHKGFAALVASTELVYGRWWSVFGLLLIAGLAIGLSLLVLLAALGLSIVWPLYSAGAVVVSVLAGMVILVVVSSLGAGVMQCVGVTLFNSLQASQTNFFSTERKRTLKTFFVVAAVIGAIFSVVFNDTDDSGMIDSDFESLMSDFASFEAELTATNLFTVAEGYAETQDGSYAEVCNELQAQLDPGQLGDCVDRNNAWAISFSSDADEQYCVDHESAGAVALGGVQAANATCLNEPMADSSTKDRAAELRQEMNTGREGE